MVKIVHAGWGRTGTMTLCAALNILKSENELQGAVVHGVLPIDKECPLWVEFATGNKKADKELLHSMYGDESSNSVYALLDNPFCEYYKEFLHAYPNCKMILLLHPGGLEKRIKSYNTNLKFISVAYYQVQNIILRPLAFLFSQTMVYLMVAKEYGHTFEYYKQGLNVATEESIAAHAKTFVMSKKNVEGNTIEAMKREIAEIKRIVPKDQLLVYSVTEGWGPLCKFLGVPVPDINFPKRDLHSSKNEMILIGILRIIAVLSILIFVSCLYLVMRVLCGFDWKLPVLIVGTLLSLVLQFKKMMTIQI